MASINVVHAGRILTRNVLAVAIAVVCMSGAGSATTPSGRVVIAAHVTIPPAWLDPLHGSACGERRDQRMVTPLARCCC